MQGRVEAREILNLTVMTDHDVIDGSSAARFTHRLVELIESGYGLDAIQPLSAIDIEAAAGRTSQVPAEYPGHLDVMCAFARLSDLFRC